MYSAEEVAEFGGKFGLSTADAAIEDMGDVTEIFKMSPHAKFTERAMLAAERAENKRIISTTAVMRRHSEKHDKGTIVCNRERTINKRKGKVCDLVVMMSDI